MYICHCCNRTEVNSDVDVTKIMKEAVEIILKTLSYNNSTAAFQASSKLTRNNLDPKNKAHVTIYAKFTKFVLRYVFGFIYLFSEKMEKITVTQQ